MVPVLADPLPELLLSAETGALTDPGRVTEISDPPVFWLELPVLVPVPAADPLPEPLLAAETGATQNGPDREQG